jgi:rSAM/selenodomain-associated transferase 2
MSLSFIIPVYNEADSLVPLMTQISRLEHAGHEVIVVDGGSTDGSREQLGAVCQKIVSVGKGRARQMNAGVRQASADVMVFLHADTQLPEQADKLIESAIARRPWGRFDVSLSGHSHLLRIIESMMNLRSRLTGIATGDQCIFVRRDLFWQTGGYPDIPLMEDIAISKQLKKRARPACLKARVLTSSRRWQQQGVLRTVLLMWGLRLAYFFGISPQTLHRLYYRT